MRPSHHGSCAWEITAVALHTEGLRVTQTLRTCQKTPWLFSQACGPALVCHCLPSLPFLWAAQTHAGPAAPCLPQPAQAGPGASSHGPSSHPTTVQLHFHDRLLHNPGLSGYSSPTYTHAHTCTVCLVHAYHFRLSLCTPTSLRPPDTRKPPIGALGTLSSPDRFLDLAPSQNSDLSRGSMTTTTPIPPDPPLGGWHREMLRE